MGAGRENIAVKGAFNLMRGLGSLAGSISNLSVKLANKAEKAVEAPKESARRKEETQNTVRAQPKPAAPVIPAAKTAEPVRRKEEIPSVLSRAQWMLLKERQAKSGAVETPVAKAETAPAAKEPVAAKIEVAAAAKVEPAALPKSETPAKAEVAPASKAEKEEESEVEPEPEPELEPEPEAEADDEPSEIVDADLPEDKTPERKVSMEEVLKGFEFENKMRRLQSEVYVKDFFSDVEAQTKKALTQIGKMPKPLAMKLLKRILQFAGDSLKSIEVLGLISTLNDDVGEEKSLFAKFLRHKNPSVRLAALGALAKYKDKESYSILFGSLKDSDALVRKQTLNLLVWNHNDKCLDAVLKMLHDEDGSVKTTAIQFCSSLKLVASISPLISLLSDQSNVIQNQASEALMQVTGQDFGFKAFFCSNKAKNEAREAWRSWWLSNQATFGA